MHVVIIHGQSHKHISYHMGHMLLDKLQADVVTEYFLPQDMPHFCTGCTSCLHAGIETCPHARDVQPILKSIRNADILIFTTPVYCMHTTGSMKALLDHLFTLWMPHRPEAIMYQKKAVILSAGAGSGMKSAIRDIKDSVSFWGISDISTYGLRGGAPSWSKVSDEAKIKLDQRMQKIVKHLEKQKNHDKVSMKNKGYFMMMRMMQKKGWSASELDIKYWKEQGWLGKTRPWHTK